MRAGAERIACALYPVALSLHRVSAEALTQALAGLGHDAGVDLDVLWRGSELVDEALGDEPVPPLSPRVAVRAAEYSLPAGLVAELDARLREHASADRLDEVLEELTTIRRECGWPPLASPIGQVLGSQALLHVLSAQRWRFVVDELRDLVEGRYGSPPADVDPTVRRAVELLGDGVPSRGQRPEGARRAPRGRRGPRLERGGAAPARALRRGRRAAAPRRSRRAAAATSPTRPG